MHPVNGVGEIWDCHRRDKNDFVIYNDVLQFGVFEEDIVSFKLFSLSIL